MDVNQQARTFIAQSQTALDENRTPLATRYLMLAASLPISDAEVLEDLLARAASRNATDVAQQALSRSPLRQSSPKLQLQYAETLSRRGQYDAARAGYLALVKSDEHGPDALLALGHLAMCKGEIAEAFDFAEQLQARVPDSTVGLSLTARIETEIGAYDRAQAALDKANAISPLKAPSHYLLQRRAIAAGDIGEMFFRLYQREKPPNPLPALDVPFLGDLNDARGKNIVVFGEQGFGDILQFCRYLPHMVGMSDYLGYLVHPKLKRIVSALGLSGVEIFDMDLSSRCPDYVVPLMDLPHLLGVKTIDPAPYLTAEPAALERWRKRIGAGGFKIGIVWQGNAQAAIDYGRSIPLHHLARLAELEGVRLISLQKGTGIEQIAALPRHEIIEVFEDLDSGPDAYIDTAAAASCLDLIVTIDTSVAHLIGALGLPGVLLAKCYPDWRWTFPPTDRSIWYANTKIIRQPAPDDWAASVDMLMDHVKERLQNA
ncbi:hypothetical protein [Abyssibius alkaniclasticus]|uniref:hypothetical protein n=1 Tax=Abyssibius alkaniclasticus TaxID=2881234 RepID=UPI0040586FCE